MLIHAGAYVSSGGTSEKISLVYGRVDTSQAGGIHFKTLVAGYWFAARR